MSEVELNSNHVNKNIKAHILSDEKMREIGFTDHSKDRWYFCKCLGDLDISFNVTIPKDGSDIDIITLDENFLQPYDYQYILSQLPTHKVALITQEFAEKWMKYLQDNGVLSGWEVGDYI